MLTSLPFSQCTLLIGVAGPKTKNMERKHDPHHGCCHCGDRLQRAGASPGVGTLAHRTRTSRQWCAGDHPRALKTARRKREKLCSRKGWRSPTSGQYSEPDSQRGERYRQEVTALTSGRSSLRAQPNCRNQTLEAGRQRAALPEAIGQLQGLPRVRWVVPAGEL